MAIDYKRQVRNLAMRIAFKPRHADSSPVSPSKDRVHELVIRFGQNPMAYLAMEGDKFYFFSDQPQGVCAYTVVGSVMVVCGDMLCDDRDADTFLKALMSFAGHSRLDIVFLNMTEHFADAYRRQGFGIMKYGEDACFRLADYSMKGGAVAKVRAAVNHANKQGMAVSEYIPLKQRDPALEAQFQEISDEWFKDKKMPPMQFMLGGTGLDDPRKRRYFFARDVAGKIWGFVVFLPYMGGAAYLADVTRRRQDAPQGVLEKIITDAFIQMREEGVLWGNLGLSPLYNVAEKNQATISEKISDYIYEHLNDAYDFKALHHAKEKYAPTHWEPRYVAYYPKPMSLKYAYAIVKAQVPGSIIKIAGTQFKAKLSFKKSKEKGKYRIGKHSNANTEGER